MLKEIYEQPRAITDTSWQDIPGYREHLPSGDWPDRCGAEKDKKVYLVACGTSWHASLIGKFHARELARIPAEVEIASEFRYRNPIVGKDTLFVARSPARPPTPWPRCARQRNPAQGRWPYATWWGALPHARRTASYTHAGPEIGVSTKAFTAQLVALFLLALHVVTRQGVLDNGKVRGVPRRVGPDTLKG
jgi:glucosamine--fructose-6-phosphate aminotransferase (isomerizing)